MIAQVLDLIFFLLKFSQVSTQTLPSAQTFWNPSRHCSVTWSLLGFVLDRSVRFSHCFLWLAHPLFSTDHSVGEKYFHLCMSRYASSNAGPQQQQLLTKTHEWFEHLWRERRPNQAEVIWGSFLEKVMMIVWLDIISCLIITVTLPPVFERYK